MSKTLCITGLGLLTACLVLATPAVGHAQYYPYGSGGAYPGSGSTAGYGALAPSYTSGYGTYTPGIGVYTPSFGFSISGVPAYGGYGRWYGGYAPRYSSGYGGYGYWHGQPWGHHHRWRR